MPGFLLSMRVAKPPIAGGAVHCCRIFTWLIAGRNTLTQALEVGGFRFVEMFKHQRTPAYCFLASNWLVVSCSLSVIATVMVLPSADTVMRTTLITFPSRLSVSSKEFFPVRFTDTLVVPGSPL